MATRIIKPIQKGTVVEQEPKPKKIKCSECGRLLDESEFSMDGESRLSFCKECEETIKESEARRKKQTEKKVVAPKEEKVVVEEEKPLTAAEQHKKNVSLWGKGFSDDDYLILNAKLEEFKRYYPLKTAMHREALITYLKYAQRRDNAIEASDQEAADKWGKLAAKQAQDAKINPSQLSIADLSNGISNVGKIIEAVEKATDIIPLLPTYVRAPRDEIDYTIWQYVNYCRRLTNMPDVSYEEVYKFTQEKYKENYKQYEFLIKEDNKKYKEPI